MSQATRAIPNPAFTAEPASARAYVETTKPGITRLVTITACVGLVMGALASGDVSPARLAYLVIIVAVGTALASGGANALNMWLEAARDARMRRTSGRPLPSHRLAPGGVARFGVVTTLLGVLVLALGAGPAPAIVALACAGVYVFVYTPLKTRTAWNTVVGTIPGALPPIIGTSAVAATSGPGALAEPLGWSLFALMTVWQLPHFYAIAWMYRDDYERGGFRMLSLGDDRAARTSLAMVALAALLIPATLSPALAAPHLLGLPYIALASLTGVAFLAACVRFRMDRTRSRARAVFLASIAHLPLLMLAMVIEALTRSVV
ncbi:MAG: heme o synthase [Phycisphaerales bacterium]